MMQMPASAIDQTVMLTPLSKKLRSYARPPRYDSRTNEMALPVHPRSSTNIALTLARIGMQALRMIVIGSTARIKSEVALITPAVILTAKSVTSPEEHFPETALRRKLDGLPHWKIAAKK